MRSCVEASEKDYQDLESLKYFNESFGNIVQLDKYPSIKKLFIKYNTELCNPNLVKVMVERTNICNVTKHRFHVYRLFNQYCIINSAQQNILDEESSEE